MVFLEATPSADPAPYGNHHQTISRWAFGHHSIDTNPFLEVVRHQPEISLIGSLPPAYGEFLTTFGFPASELPRLTADIRAHLVIYLKDAWGTYGTIKASLPAVKLVFFGPAENPATRQTQIKSSTDPLIILRQFTTAHLRTSPWEILTYNRDPNSTLLPDDAPPHLHPTASPDLNLSPHNTSLFPASRVGGGPLIPPHGPWG
jgi:hypothetical protein